jgi:hypothetical protein
MQYFEGALLEVPPEVPSMVFFLFFSSLASQAFMVPYWLMAALASSLYDRLEERIRQSCSCMVSPLWNSSAFSSSVSTWCAPYCARLLNSWYYLKTEWFPYRRSRNSESLRCMVPTDRWWSRKITRNSSHNT